jgi:hypothetical protein
MKEKAIAYLESQVATRVKTECGDCFVRIFQVFVGECNP